MSSKETHILWNLIPKEYNFIARDRDGYVYAYLTEPTMTAGVWSAKGDIADVSPSAYVGVEYCAVYSRPTDTYSPAGTYNLTTAFKEVIEAILEGIPVYYRGSWDSPWKRVEQGFMPVDLELEWLIGEEVKTPLDIPWDFIADCFKYAALDSDGSVCLFEAEPSYQEGFWIPHNTEGILVKKELNQRYFKLDKSYIDPRYSLTKRP